MRYLFAKNTLWTKLKLQNVRKEVFVVTSQAEVVVVVFFLIWNSNRKKVQMVKLGFRLNYAHFDRPINILFAFLCTPITTKSILML